MSKEKLNPIQRSVLWRKVYGVLAGFILKESLGDALDRPSAATEIEQILNRHIEQLQRERDWINVEERLPEKGIKVLTCLGPYGLSVDIDFISEYSDENKFHYEPTATHWMPLPEPPKPEK